MLQDAVELAAAREDREHRRRVGELLAEALGLGRREARLLEVTCYSSSLRRRKRAADLLAVALGRVARQAAA